MYNPGMFYIAAILLLVLLVVFFYTLKSKLRTYDKYYERLKETIK